MRHLLAAGGVALCLLVALSGSALAQQQTEEAVVRQSVQSVLEMDTFRGVDRLPRVTLDSTSGDLTIIFAMRRPLTDDPRQIVDSATDDVFSILWAVYASSDAPRIRTTTVLGTYAVTGRYERPREIPLVRAVLSADRAANFDWANASRLDPSRAFDTWWVEGELTSGL